MLILPFIHNVISNTNNSFEVNVIKVLTIGGQTIWEENNSLHIDTDILNPNDIYRKGRSIKFDKKLQLYEVDTEKTNISDIYNWNECALGDSEIFCWKTYYYFTGSNKMCWLKAPTNEKLNTYNVKELIDAIIKRK